MGSPHLSVLCWDHPRCTSPVRAAARSWGLLHPDMRVSVSARPLAAFNDQPLEQVAASHDLVFVDHPMMGTVAHSGVFAPLEQYLPAGTLAALAADSIAGSQDTYVWNRHTWATAVDAACQVAAVDDEGLRLLGADQPRHWDEVVDLARKVPGSVALPLYPSDAILSLLSISANMRAHAAAGARAQAATGASAGGAADGLISEAATDLLVALARAADPVSFTVNPPQLLDMMSVGAAGTVPAYVPLVFGYTNYARRGGPGRRLRFGDIPSAGERPAGAVLGGAGLAVSAASPHRPEAAAFAAWLAGAPVQRQLVLEHGGQPASRTTWDDPRADAIAGGFFSGTRTTMDNAFVRPRHRWWPAYQEQAGTRLVRLLRTGAQPARIYRELTQLLDLMRAEEPVE